MRYLLKIVCQYLLLASISVLFCLRCERLSCFPRRLAQRPPAPSASSPCCSRSRSDWNYPVSSHIRGFSVRFESVLLGTRPSVARLVGACVKRERRLRGSVFRVPAAFRWIVCCGPCQSRSPFHSPTQSDWRCVSRVPFSRHLPQQWALRFLDLAPPPRYSCKP